MIKINAVVPKSLSLASEIVAAEILSAMKDSTLLVEGEAKADAGFVTGNLARSINSAVVPLGGDVKGIVSASASYASFVNDGTGLFGPKHELITPKNKKAMRWKGSGGFIFAKSTKGQHAKKFMEKGYAAAKQRVEERFNMALAIAVKGMGK